MPSVRLPGTTIHHQVVGRGPVLVIAQSGEGDADRTVDLVSHLAEDFTVVTYDRRGLSRSVPDDLGREVTMADHADDLHRLIAHITDEPVTLLGCSFGAAIGLHLVTRHPGQVATLVAHEPIASWLLPDPLAAQHRHELVEIQAAYLADGLAAALPKIVRTLGILSDDNEVEPGLASFPFDAQRIRNFDRFLRHDFTTAVRDRLDPAAVAAADVRILAAAGKSTPMEVFDRRCAEALAQLCSTDLQVFAGGHNGNLGHPRAWAATLRDLLAQPALG